MANISKRNRRREKEVLDSAKNRREIIAAQLSRRDLMKMGLLTTAGFLIPKNGLSARAPQFGGGGSFGGGCYGFYGQSGTPVSPPTTPFVEALPIMPIHQPVTQFTGPAPTANPNTAINPATGLPFEGRTRPHQAFTQFPAQKLYEVHQQQALVSVHPQLPTQTLWSFNGSVPAPTYVAHYGEPILVRNYNNLPANNGGFGIQSVSTHLHNGHTPSESDGFPCDFFAVGQYYDQHYPNVLAGFSSTNPPNGDINESMSTLWYHDHRVDFTSQNVYKGLAGFFLLFNQFDTGNETMGFHLPTFPDFDIPMIFGDRLFDPTTGLLSFDLANRDGILGDKFLVNGKIQPFFQVKRRRYRFRWLNGGPSRFYKFFLTNPNNLSQTNNFWVISNDGNLLPNPVQVSGLEIAVAERMDVIVDFSAFPAGSVLRLENRLQQCDGAGPTDNIVAAGQGNQVLEFRVVSDAVTDASVNPATNPHFYDVPARTTTQQCRQFKFDRRNGQWVINDKFFDCNEVRFRVKRNTAETWNLDGGFNWQHPVHIHFEEHQIVSRNRNTPIAIERGRKDVVRLGENDSVQLFFRFRDFVGRYPMHCHNVVHEDHAMMLRFDIDDVGDSNEGCDSHHH
jgi:FtsP/CotA-like multicopper oxidase with cupredoxin domain